MTRWFVGTLATLLVIGALAAVAARYFGKSGSRASILVSVVAHWLGAYVLWNFAGGLALYYGLLSSYPGWLFAAVALAGGILHYRSAVRGGRERGLTVFVGAQLAWLVIVLAQNGLFSG